MQKMSIIKYALAHSLGTAFYVALVGYSLYNGGRLFGSIDSAITPIVVLLTLVVSVAIIGLLLFCRPLLWYLDGKKKEAVWLVLYTVGFLAVYTLVLLIILASASPTRVLIQS